MNRGARHRLVPQRIKDIAGFVPESSVVADIGCDHGYLCLELLLRQTAQRVIACDISTSSLEKAKQLLRGSFVEERFEFRLGDGLEVLRAFEVDTIVITGMGGMRIQKILAAEPDKARSASHILLGPQKNAMETRRFLAENGYVIERERLAEMDGRFYPLFLVSPGEAKLEDDPFWYFFGRGLLGDSWDRVARYLDHEIAKLNREVAGSQDPQKLDFLTSLEILRREMP